MALVGNWLVCSWCAQFLVKGRFLISLRAPGSTRMEDMETVLWLSWRISDHVAAPRAGRTPTVTQVHERMGHRLSPLPYQGSHARQCSAQELKAAALEPQLGTGRRWRCLSQVVQGHKLQRRGRHGVCSQAAALPHH